MSPLEYIATGIKDGDWDKVVTGYNTLTGQTIAVPDNLCDPTDMQDALLHIKNILNDLEEFSQTSLAQKADSSEDTNKKRGQKKKRKPEELSCTKIKQNDEEPTAVETKPQKKKRTARPPAKRYKVTCNECQEKFESDRKEGDIGQKCSKCLSRRKGAFSGGQ